MLNSQMLRVLKAVSCWLLELVSRVALLLVGAFWMSFYNSQSWVMVSIVTAGSLVLMALAMLMSGRQRRLFEKKARKAAIRRLLRALGTSFEQGGVHHVRCNVMISDKKRQVRKVDGETAYNMTGDPDENMEMAMFKGISGTAAQQRDVVLGDLRKEPLSGAPGWGLKKKETKKVRKTIKTIISCPIFNPDDQHGDLLGTMQVDSDEVFDTLIPDKERAMAIARAFSDSLSFVLKS